MEGPGVDGCQTRLELAYRVRDGVSDLTMVDRRRGWLTESRFNITMSSTLTPAATGGLAQTHMMVRITQHMKTQAARTP